MSSSAPIPGKPSAAAELVSAAQAGDVKAVQALLDAGSDINGVDEVSSCSHSVLTQRPATERSLPLQRMLSPLIASVINLGGIPVTQELVARGANVNQAIPDLLQTPLQCVPSGTWLRCPTSLRSLRALQPCVPSQ